MHEARQSGTVVRDCYRILSVLGKGGSGITYIAEETVTKRHVALKELSLKGLSDWKKLALFEREAQVLANLDHPAIPKYVDYFQVDTPDNRFFYIAQELVKGKSLADLVATGKRFSEADVRRIALEVLQILQYLHNLNPPIIHRDIKPQNIIRQNDGQIFLVDFGAVQTVYQSTVAFGSTVVGTYGYMAPEQFHGEAYPTTDLYGLGATLLNLLTHQPPSDLPKKRLKCDFRPYIKVSQELADWLDKALEPLAEERFDSASSAIAAIAPSPTRAPHISPTPSSQEVVSEFGSNASPYQDEKPSVLEQVPDIKPRPEHHTLLNHPQSTETLTPTPRVPSRRRLLQVATTTAACGVGLIVPGYFLSGYFLWQSAEIFDTESLKTFADWCHHQDRLTHEARNTVEALLRYAETDRCDWAEEELNLQTSIELDSQGIRDVEPLTSLPNLTYLHLDDNYIVDISPLADANQLTFLSLQSNQITNISSLESLTNLTWLSLNNNQIADISPLTNLTQLISVSLGGNRITDVSPLANLPRLDNLSLDRNYVVDVSPLASSTSLIYLDLQANQLTDISPLANLTQLSWLNLENNQVTDVAPLANLTQLTTLRLKNNQITDMSSLESLTKLD